jgi:hypothetical protein
MTDVDVLIYYPLFVSVSRWPSSQKNLFVNMLETAIKMSYIQLDFISYT